MELDDLKLIRAAVNDLRWSQAAALVTCGLRNDARAKEYMHTLARLERALNEEINEMMGLAEQLRGISTAAEDAAPSDDRRGKTTIDLYEAAMKDKGKMTLKAVAAARGLSEESVRKQLAILSDKGLVKDSPAPLTGKAGKPARLWEWVK
jgi:response regulator of citrate/malate metabolism